MSTVNLSTPLSKESIAHLSAGEEVLLSGTIFGARDAAHRRLVEMISRNEELPFPVKDQIIYYVGPCPARPGEPIGSAGPTTSARMDAFLPQLLEKGLMATIGKGSRSEAALKSMLEYRAIYFAAIGGAAALLTSFVKKCEVIAFEDLGPEAVLKIEVVEMPLIVAFDTRGRDIYRLGPEKYKAKY